MVPAGAVPAGAVPAGAVPAGAVPAAVVGEHLAGPGPVGAVRAGAAVEHIAVPVPASASAVPGAAAGRRVADRAAVFDVTEEDDHNDLSSLSVLCKTRIYKVTQAVIESDFNGHFCMDMWSWTVKYFGTNNRCPLLLCSVLVCA